MACAESLLQQVSRTSKCRPLALPGGESLAKASSIESKTSEKGASTRRRPGALEQRRRPLEGAALCIAPGPGRLSLEIFSILFNSPRSSHGFEQATGLPRGPYKSLQRAALSLRQRAVAHRQRALAAPGIFKSYIKCFKLI